jgi:cell division initiation protein
MRLTPTDIRQQQFTERIFRGFDRDEVDRFLDQMAEDYESILKENALLKEQLTAFEERSRSVVELQQTLQDTLVGAQKITEQIKLSARREGELMVREAQAEGEKLLDEARTEEARILSDINALKRSRRQLVEDLRATLARYERLFADDLGAPGGSPLGAPGGSPLGAPGGSPLGAREANPLDARDDEPA